MDTISLIEWHKEFDQIMSSGDPEQLQLDQLRDLHNRTTEQQDMWEESTEVETDRML